LGNSYIGTLIASFWLAYLLDPLSVIVDKSGASRAVGVAALVTFALIYLAGITAGRRARRLTGLMPVRIGVLTVVGMVACCVAMAPAAGEHTLTGAPYVCAFCVMSMPRRLGIAATLILIAGVEFATRIVPGWHDHGYGFGVALAAVAVFSFRLAFDRNRELIEAREELADLAVEDERNRIARDLHDILGHSLTVITVKAELAQRLLDVDPARARAELADLERLGRDALADVRSTAMGVRGMSLPGEIAEARTALESAGIDAQLPTAADNVPSRWRELYAWTVRESVTNVIRHSRATHCTIEMTPSRISVVDDGVGIPQGSASTGSGLSGLRQRAQLAGATMSTSVGLGGHGLQVLVEVPS
jgi:two-component system sensor histidine kinase DesK